VSLKDYGDFVSSVGFPIAIAILLLWRFDNQNHATIKALNALTMAVDKLCAEIERRQR
jgi:hypothetical protein